MVMQPHIASLFSSTSPVDPNRKKRKRPTKKNKDPEEDKRPKKANGRKKAKGPKRAVSPKGPKKLGPKKAGALRKLRPKEPSASI